MNKKAQSAMEFLMTYGWAVLIMLIVIAILFMLGVFNPTTGAPNSCVLPSGFSCYGYSLINGGGLTLDLGQASGGEVLITRIGCSAKESSPTMQTVNTRIQSGHHKNLTGTLVCEKEDGTYPVEDEYYRGTLYIEYTDVRTGILHDITGDIAYHVESGETGTIVTPTPTATATPTPTPTATPLYITGCGIVDTPGTYSLSPSFTQPTSLDDLIPYCLTGWGDWPACICIRASDVTLDCGGSVTGAAIDTDPHARGTGIGVDAASNVIVRNCQVDYFDEAIVGSISDNLEVSGNNVQHSSYAIDIESAGETPVLGVTVTGNTLTGFDSDGIYLYGVNGGVVETNSLTGDGDSEGMYVCGGSSGLTVSGNTISNVYDGIAISQSATGNTFTGNSISSSSTCDFYCSDSATNTDSGDNVCSGNNNCDWVSSCPGGCM